MNADTASTESTEEPSGGSTIPPTTGSPIKTLRSVPPDLKIVVGDGDLQKTYECYSQVMAMNSGYIDTALAMPMKEHTTMTLTFPELDPTVWDKMMSYLQPGASDPEFVDDIRVVLPWYDKYDFDDGLELCDRVFGKAIVRPIVDGSNLDESTAAMELLYLYAHRMTASTMEEAKKRLLELLQSGVEGRYSLVCGHVSQLVPALRADDDAWSYTKDRILRRFPVDEDRQKYVDSLAFPDLVVSCIDAHLKQSDLASKLASTLSQAKSMEKELLPLVINLRVEVSTSGGGPADGVDKMTSGSWMHTNRYNYCFYFVLNAALGWIIRPRDTTTPLYVCSERPFNELLPPKTGWKPFQQTDPPQAAPILKYIMAT